jgi:adenine phosphoribosyltransferase
MNYQLEQQIIANIREVPDFPKPGISFKDITPILAQPKLCGEIAAELIKRLQPYQFDVIVGIESRGFLFSMLLAQKLAIPFIPIRKKGKLPWHTAEQEYHLEYGSECIEIHSDSLKPGYRVLIHDDLLATGGTAVAACCLIEKLGAHVEAMAFLISLDFLPGRARLLPYSSNIISLVAFNS